MAASVHHSEYKCCHQIKNEHSWCINKAFFYFIRVMPAVISLAINSVNLAGIYLLKVINRNDRTKCELTLKLTVKT